MDLFIEHVNHGIWLTILLSMPAVLLAAGIGLIVGILQAATQVQEQTISAAPKILGVFLLLILTGGMMLNVLTNYLRDSAHLAFEVIPHGTAMVLSSSKKQVPDAVLDNGFSPASLAVGDSSDQNAGNAGATYRSRSHLGQTLPQLSIAERLQLQKKH